MHHKAVNTSCTPDPVTGKLSAASAHRQLQELPPGFTGLAHEPSLNFVLAFLASLSLGVKVIVLPTLIAHRALLARSCNHDSAYQDAMEGCHTGKSSLPKFPDSPDISIQPNSPFWSRYSFPVDCPIAPR
jgi:hypothetical protein